MAERTKELSQLARELKDRDERRARLLAKFIRAQEEERKRIARELHDETCQTVAALVRRGRRDAGHAAGPEPPADSRDQGSRGTGALGASPRHLRPAAFGARRPRPRVGRPLVRRPESRPGRHRGAVRDRRAGDAPAGGRGDGGLPRRPGGADERAPACRRHERPDPDGPGGGRLSIEIEDDGKGFEPEAVATPESSGRGLGLLGIRERVELLGGSVTIDSTPGEGTRVAVTVPLPAEP